MWKRSGSIREHKMADKNLRMTRLGIYPKEVLKNVPQGTFFQKTKQLSHIHVIEFDAAILKNDFFEFFEFQKSTPLFKLVFFYDLTENFLPIHGFDRLPPFDDVRRGAFDAYYTGFT